MHTSHSAADEFPAKGVVPKTGDGGALLAPGPMPEQVAKLSFWGVRGSTPTVDRATSRYGGNTSCLELITPGGTELILDCGTGLRMLGKRRAATNSEKPLDTHIFVTHYHWDHIQGIPFFAPLYSTQNRFHFYSHRSEFLGRDSLKRVFEAQMAHPYFPVDLSAMSAVRDFAEVAGGDSLTVGDTCARMCWLNHPQGCLGFRFDTPAGSIVYATDHEPGRREFDRNLLELAESADIFISDAQFTPDQLERHRGWGHSSWLEAVRLAESAGVRHLVLFHHDPDSSDRAVDDILAEARRKFPNTWAAAEGMVMTLDQGRAEVAIPAERQGLRREAHFRARVAGSTDDGKAFEEETVIRNLSLNGALLYLDHAPRLQSELRVLIENQGGEHGNSHLALRGYVVRIEPDPRGSRTGVGIVFTE